jgi:hypothetical protein
MAFSAAAAMVCTRAVFSLPRRAQSSLLRARTGGHAPSQVAAGRDDGRTRERACFALGREEGARVLWKRQRDSRMGGRDQCYFQL